MWHPCFYCKFLVRPVKTLTLTFWSSVFNTFFGIGFDGIPFLLPVELTPLQTRGKSVAIATGCFWLCSVFHLREPFFTCCCSSLLDLFVVMISPVLISNIQWGTYVLWCGTNLSFIPMIYFLSKFLLRDKCRV